MLYALIFAIAIIAILVAVAFPKCDVCGCWSSLLFQDSKGVKRCQSCNHAEHEAREEMIADQNAIMREAWADVKD